MPSTVHPDVMDSALSVLSANAQTVVALSAMPSSYADAAGAARVASAHMASQDFTLSDSATGRTLSIAAKASNAITAGTVSTIALLDDSGQRVLFSAPIPAVAVSNGDVVQFLNWSISLAPTV